MFDEKYLGAFGFGVIIGVKENDEWMIKVSYLDEREWMVKREIGRKKKNTNTNRPKQRHPCLAFDICFRFNYWDWLRYDISC